MKTLKVYNKRPQSDAPLRYKSPQGEDNYATQVWVVVEPDGRIRPAEFIGSESRSGLTQYVNWVEEGAVLALRAREAAYAIRGVSNGTSLYDPEIWVVYFGDHCLSPVGWFRVYDPARLKKWTREWLSWRQNPYPPLPEVPEDPEEARHYWFAKWVSREYEPGTRLTDGEGRALSRFKDATLEVFSDRFIITVPSLGIKAQQLHTSSYWEILPPHEEDPESDSEGQSSDLDEYIEVQEDPGEEE